MPPLTEPPSRASLLAIVADLRARLAAGERDFSLRVLDPDLARGCYPGERIEVAGRAHVHRPYRVWLDLADRLGLRLLTPTRLTDGLVELRLERLDERARWQAPGLDVTERYGQASGFQRISKLEDPDLLLDVGDALARMHLPARPRILDIGVNRGDTLALLCALRPELTDAAEFIGVDHSASAIALARERFPAANFRFITADAAALPDLDIGPLDLAISMGTLQSPGVDDRALLRHLVQDRLGRSGALLLGVPNCRYLDGERLHGARIKNLREPELSLVIADIAYYRRYLQQHRRHVYVTGRSYLLVTAVARSEAP